MHLALRRRSEDGWFFRGLVVHSGEFGKVGFGRLARLCVMVWRVVVSHSAITGVRRLVLVASVASDLQCSSQAWFFRFYGARLLASACGRGAVHQAESRAIFCCQLGSWPRCKGSR